VVPVAGLPAPASGDPSQSRNENHHFRSSLSLSFCKISDPSAPFGGWRSKDVAADSIAGSSCATVGQRETTLIRDVKFVDKQPWDWLAANKNQCTV
jgi:hypothetical protein